jgi:hypothetical protein
MIENLFVKKKLPLILNECTLYIGINHYDINTTYIFKENTSVKVEQFGHEWIQNHLKMETFHIGYFSSPPYTDFLFNRIDESDDVAIIGYSKRTRYIVNGISISKDKSNFGEYYLAKFKFLECKLLL